MHDDTHQRAYTKEQASNHHPDRIPSQEKSTSLALAFIQGYIKGVVLVAGIEALSRFTKDISQPNVLFANKGINTKFPI